MRKLLRIAAFLALQGVIVLLLLEAVGRVFDPLGISYYPETSRILDTMIREEPIGYRNRPGLEGRFYGVPVRINSLGLRDRELPAERDPDEFRILVMGDSYPFGIGVPVEDTIPRQIERLANERGDGTRRYRAVNMGVISYNTEQELIQLESLGLGLEPDLVMLFFAPNDMEPKMWVFDRRASLVADLAQRSYATTLLFVLQRELRQRLRARSGDGSAAEFESDEYWVDRPGWERVERSLVEIQRLCRERDVPFILFATVALAEVPRRRLLELGRSEGFPVLIYESPWDPRERLRYVNSRTDGHPNAEGCRLTAELIYTMLAARGVLH